MFRDTLVKAAAAGVCGLLATGAASPAVARTQAGPSAPSVLRDYVALGDSYAAGPGIAPVEDEACGRSGANYASLLGERARRFTDVSCAGATTRDLYRRQNGDRPQIAALRSRASLVTLSIGGNDLGFTEIIQTCAQAAQTAPTGSPCKDYYAKDGSDALAKRMRGVAASVGKVLRDVKRRSPRAQVLLVGYPSLLPDDGSACRRAVPFAVGDFPYLRDTIKRLNAALAREAARSRVRYVDMYRETVGRDMCQAEGTRLIEPIVNPVGASAAHPNGKYMAVAAKAIGRALAR